MGRSRFPGKPLKFYNRKRISVISGAVYHETAAESQSNGDGATALVFTGEKEEEEKKDQSNETDNETSADTVIDKQDPNKSSELAKSPVRTRSQNKMETVKNEKPKIKKTVTFGTVESCEDTFLPLKKISSKNHAPLVSIIKKKSALKQTEYSTFNSILKPAKLTDISSKISDHHEGYLKKNFNISKPLNKFSQFSEMRCVSPPPRNSSPETNSSKFVLPSRSAHSSRVIKPNKRFMDGDDVQNPPSNTIGSGKVLKKPKLKRLVFNNILGDDNPDDDYTDKCNDNNKNRDSASVKSNLFKSKGNAFLGANTRKSNRDLFSFDESSHDENYNSESVETPGADNYKEERGGHALRKLVDISDASSTSSSSGSGSEDSWESDGPGRSDDEPERPPPSSPEREKTPASQLLSGKVIIREARLHLNPPAQATVGPDGPFSSFSVTSSRPGSPTTVTCGVCGAVRFYRHMKQARKFGIFSCESCRKFISKMLKKARLAELSGPIVMQCLKGEGTCHVPPIVRSQQWKLLRCANKTRCPACWLKMCLKAFQVPTDVRNGLTSMLPTYMRASSKSTNTLTQVNPLRMTGSSPLTGQSTLTGQPSLTGQPTLPGQPSLTGQPVLAGPTTLSGQPVFSVLGSSESEAKSFTSHKSPKRLSEEIPEKVENKDKKERSALESTNDGLSRKRRLTRVKVKKKDKEAQLAEDPKRQKVELKGPRVKHVCRSASIVLGQPIATFPTQEEKEKQDKPSDNEESHNILKEKDKLLPDIQFEDSENKIAEFTADSRKEETEILNDTKKRKIEMAVPTKLLSRGDSSEDESIELVTRKAVSKPLANITNVRGRSQKCDLNRPELISVDFWESYDPDEVCSSGFGLIGTTAFTIARLCFLCGSAGNEKMLICTSCCEWYHSWCAEEPGGGTDGAWTCARCVSCARCSRPAARLRCRVCAGHYHAACLTIAPPDHRTDWPQICSTCLKCKSCDSGRVSKFVGSLPFCSSCFKLRQKGNYCPLCQACYKDNDFDSKMMECGSCARWVHASCEQLSGEGYQLLSALPPSIEYICRQCMPHDPPWRKMLTEHLKGKLLHLLKLLAKNKKACALLKLTPHKNTPVANKAFHIMSPQAIRKLHFDNADYSMKNTMETKVYRNTARGRRHNPPQSKMDVQAENNTENIWHCSPNLFNEVDIDKEEIQQPSHKVVNLQEPLMQNKEICFSTGLFGVKTEYDSPCVEVHENNPQDNARSALMLTVSDDKYESISDDETAQLDSIEHKEEELSPNLSINSSIMNDTARIISPSLLDIKKRVNSDEYISLKDFNQDMKEVIERTLNKDLKLIYKQLFSETFPWFDCEINSLQPNLEVEGEQDYPQMLKDQEIMDSKNVKTTNSNVEQSFGHIVPKLESEGDKLEELLEVFSIDDSRTCVLCKKVKDGLPAMEGRLLYCGQNDWIHANCALWSAEVFEEIDGSLQNVHSAISRGKMIKCATCELKGASVGCCAKNCSETYHYSCARKVNCAFMDDKRVFCPLHGKDVPKKSLQKDTEFELTRPVYVELDKKKKRYSEINKVQFLLGSLTVKSLGKIVPSVSDFEDFLMPVDFMCTRLFWSSKKPSKIVQYTIKTKLILAEPLPGFDYGVNITVDHSMESQIVERVLAEIGDWHDSLENGGGKTAFMLKKDKSPIKFGYGVTLENLAVKQVVEYLLDNVCKQEQQDDEEPQNTADLLPPELKDAIFEDLNHDLLDGISMQDIFADLKNEFYGAISQSDDKNVDKFDSRSTTDFIDELLNARLESGSKELKRSKSEMLLQNHNLKTLTTGRGQQRSSSLTWNNKFDTSLLSSTIKRCKMERTSTITGKLSPIQKANLNDSSLDTAKETSSEEKKKPESNSSLCDEAPHTSGLNYHTTSPKEKESESTNEKSDKTEGYYTDVIDFYTKIHCSPISQLDGACDWSGSESTCSSRPTSPHDSDTDFTPIQQLDGAEENGHENIYRNQTNQFVYRAAGTESTYTVTIAGNTMSGQPELIMRPLDDGSGPSSQNEQPVRCDRCQCTYRNKESYDRHIPSCDIVSTSESESENPKSPESRTLTTLQNAFQGAFAQPMIIHTGVIGGTEGPVKAEGIAARRTSINTRQITINGTIVETPSPGPSNEMTMTITEQMKSGTVIFDQSKTTNVQVSANQQVLPSPQIVVTPQMLLPPKSNAGQKIMAPQLITQQGGILPYNICVKSANGNNNLQQIQSSDMTQILSGAGGLQVLSTNSNQMLTLPTNQQNIAPMLQGKNQVANFPNMASASSIALPVNSIHGMQNASILQNIQPMIRPQIQNNPTIVVPTMTTTQRLSSPNPQHKQVIIPSTSQKSPKKPSPVQPKPIFQAANRARARPMPKPTTIKRQTKVEKTYTAINQPIGPGNTVIQLQTNNQNGQPSIIVQPVANQNIMSAYVEALSQHQNQNMQYIATIAPQGDFKTAPTQFISQGGLMPQTFQIQQTENGSLVAVPSGGIPVLLPQGNVGILPQALQQGPTILPQGALQTQGIISQGPNGHTILPQAIHTQNGATIIPQGTLQGLTQGNITSQGTLLPSNGLQSTGATVVHSGIGNNQTLIPNSTLSSQGNTLIAPAPGTTILPQGALLPQFCNEQVILGSTPTLEMVTDPSGCMYLTTTQPVYYGLETIVQNTVMSSQQFVSTAMQGVLAQNSSFSATTTQVFQASKIEPIVEVPTGYVVVNNVDGVGQASGPTVVSGQAVQATQPMKSKVPVPNLTLQPLPEKSLTSNTNRQTPKVIQMGPTPMVIGSQASPGNLMNNRANINPITSQIHGMTLSSGQQPLQRTNTSKQGNVSMQPNVTLISSTGQPIMAMSQTMPNPITSFSLQSIPLSQPIVSSSVAPSANKTNVKVENQHIIEISANLQDNSNLTCVPSISVAQNIKSPTPWRQNNIQLSTNLESNKPMEMQNMQIKPNTSINSSPVNIQTSGPIVRHHQMQFNDCEKSQGNNSQMTGNNNGVISGMNLQSHQFETSLNVSHHSSVHNSSNNIIQIASGNIYPPSSIGAFDAETTLKLNKINALSKTEGGHLNFSQEIMASHSQHLAQNDKTFQNMPINENKHNMDTINGQMNIHKLNSCQMMGSNNNGAANIMPPNVMRPQLSNTPNPINIQNNQNQMCSIANNSSHGPMQVVNNTNSSMSNASSQETSSSRINITVTNDNNIMTNSQHHDMSANGQINAANGGIPQENTASNQIHILNGQIQHNRQAENINQIQQQNRQFIDNNIVNGQQIAHSSRNMSDSNVIVNMHNMTNHSMNRQAEMSHLHMQQSMPGVNNNLQNNRLMMDNLSPHPVSNINHQMHGNRNLENMHNQMLPHHPQQMGHHINNNRQMESNIHMNQQISMQHNRQIENVTNHHHQMSNIMQIQNNRTHIDNNMMNIHQHVANQMHNRQVDNTMHNMHHTANNGTNIVMNNQMDTSGPINQNLQAISTNIHNRHEAMQSHNIMNQMQSNRSSVEHANIMQHQMNNINPMSNMNILNNSMPMNNMSLQGLNNAIMHGPNIPDIKNEMPQCGGSCANGAPQFPNSQQSFDICPPPPVINSNNNGMNITAGNVMHGMNVNNTNMMINNNYSNNGQANMSTHEIMMNCNNASNHNIMIPSNANHIMLNNNTPTHQSNNQNQTMNTQVPNNQQININSMGINPPQNQIPNMENSLNRNNLPVNEPNKYQQEPQLRGKNMMGPQPNPNLTQLQTVPNNDCAKVNMNDKQNHNISNSPMGFMQLNAQNNRIINLPERNRMNNNNIENNIPQHIPQQHNIRVVTNNNNNVPGMNSDTLNFQQKTETSTTINVPFQAIPNSAPMNINVNSSNNTVNITVQNNLVDPKIASKAGGDINFPLPTSSNLIQNQSSSGSMICIPAQTTNTINLPTQNSSSISLPKAPPTQQSGIPTNVVNPMTMRPMNRVLPIHRDGQSKTPTKSSTAPKPSTVPKQTPAPVSHDMPDLSIKDENIDSDLEKAIEESKRMMEHERIKKEREELDAVRALQLSTQGDDNSSISTITDAPTEASTITTSKGHSLPSLDVEMETEAPKVLVEKNTNKVDNLPKLPFTPLKVMKRSLVTNKKSDSEAFLYKKHNKSSKLQENISKSPTIPKQHPDPHKDDGPKLIYEVTSEDGFHYSSTSLTDIWAKVVEAVQNTRKQMGLPPLNYNLPTSYSGAHLLGLNNNGLRYLVEQLPGASRCIKYKHRQGRHLNSRDNDLDLSEGFKESPWGSARTGPVGKRHIHDMFSWMASPFREEPPPFSGQESENLISRRLATLPLAMRFRHLKETSKVSVGVYRSHIHGRGLFCKRDIEEGDMVIEYAGEVIRAVLADQREKRYEGVRGRRGVAGCYMFRIDDNLVVDATLKGNAARFINHSCDPNCYSRVVDIHGHKHILIFALRRISVGEELTYDYKFPFEEVKIPCTCGAKKCRKYLN